MIEPPSKSDGPLAVILSPDEVTTAGGSGPDQMLVNVRNIGENADQYNLEIEGIDEAWYTMEERTLALFPGDSISKKIKLHPPGKGRTAPGRYVFEVVVRSQADPTVARRVTGAIRVIANPVEITLTPQKVETSAGAAPVTVVAKIRNHMGVASGAEQFFVQVLDINSTWYTLEAGSVSIVPGDSLDVPVSIHPPRGRGAVPGAHPFTIKATCQTDSALEGEAAGVVELASDPINVTLNPSDVTMLIGDAPARIMASIQNVRAPAGQYTISIDGIGPSWYTISNKTVQLAPGGSASVPIELHPPATNNVPGNYSFMVEVRPGAGMGAGVDAPIAGAYSELNLVAHPITLELVPAEVSMVGGAAPIEMQLTLGNSGAIVDKYNMEVEGLDKAWYTIVTESVSLFPSSSAKVPFTLHLPATAIRAGRYPFKVRARSHSDNAAFKEISSAVNIARLVALQIEIDPQRVTGAEGQYQVTLTNNGNADMSVVLSGRDPEAALHFVVSNTSIVVPAGDKLIVPVTVKPKDPKEPKTDRQHQFTITAHPGGSVAPGAGLDKAPSVVGELIRPGAVPPPPVQAATPAPALQPAAPTPTPTPAPAPPQRPIPVPYKPPAASAPISAPTPPPPAPTPAHAPVARPTPPPPRPAPVVPPTHTPQPTPPHPPAPTPGPATPQNLAQTAPPQPPPQQYPPQHYVQALASHNAPTMPATIPSYTPQPHPTPPVAVAQVKPRSKRGLKILGIVVVLGLIAAAIAVPALTGWPIRLFGSSNRGGEATATPVNTRTGGKVTLRLEDDKFKGGFRYSDPNRTYNGSVAQWIYSSDSAYSTMAATFEVQSQPSHTASANLMVRGLDAEDAPTYQVGKSDITITINGEVINVAPDRNPFLDDDVVGSGGPPTWGEKSWLFNPDILHVGSNSLVIKNETKRSWIPTSASDFTHPPWFMLDYAEVTWEK